MYWTALACFLLATLVSGLFFSPVIKLNYDSRLRSRSIKGVTSTALQSNAEKVTTNKESGVAIESVDELISKAIHNLSDKFLDIDLRTKRHMKMILDLYRVRSSRISFYYLLLDKLLYFDWFLLTGTTCRCFFFPRCRWVWIW